MGIAGGGPRTVVDATAFEGRALTAWIDDGSVSRGYAWDVATGRRVALRAAPGASRPRPGPVTRWSRSRHGRPVRGW